MHLVFTVLYTFNRNSIDAFFYTMHRRKNIKIPNIILKDIYIYSCHKNRGDRSKKEEQSLYFIKIANCLNAILPAIFHDLSTYFIMVLNLISTD